jgi:hypothetical protein
MRKAPGGTGGSPAPEAASPQMTGGVYTYTRPVLDDAERVERMVRNEAFFREVNERVLDVNETFGVPAESGDFVCECGDAACVERIRLTLDEYRDVRRDPTLFAIVPGHELPAVEDVVATNEHYAVVRKRPGEPAEIARELA